MNNFIYLLAVFIPIAAGAALFCMSRAENRTQDMFFAGALIAEALFLLGIIIRPAYDGLMLFSVTEVLSFELRPDSLSRIFLSILAVGFLLSGIFAIKYMKHSSRQNVFYAFMLFSEGALAGMDISANLITMYMFFEMATLLSMPLVLHDRTEASIKAALKYLFYSIAGAFLGLLCIFFVAAHCDTLSFVPGGTLNAASMSEHRGLLLKVIFIGVVGFGAKAGMYPLHGWLPTAHPVAPAPASAVLSAVITKAGVLAIVRLIYYIAGASFLRGTWVQYAWICLALITVFMGSMMAFREDVFKKRLAYSSVSQLSYVLVGLFLMTADSLKGGLLHVFFHSCIKTCLFLTAGSCIVNLEKTKVSELRGIGKSMPVTLWSFTFASLGLVGIPPAAGFVSKWFLAVGALDAGIPALSVLTPVILLISALLTAGYLLPIMIRGFFPGKDFKAPARSDEGGLLMLFPIVTLAALTMLLGIFAAPIASYLDMVISVVL